MKKRIFLGILVLLVVAAWWLARPQPIDRGEIPRLLANPANGELVFNTSGCGSCHGDHSGENPDFMLLSGGLRLESPVGTFVVPNISPDPVWGIGGWSEADFINAMVRGISPDGEHYYPAFPYTSYNRMTYQDLVDLRAYILTLPAVDGQTLEHRLTFPFNIRFALGWWKRLYLDDSHVVDLMDADPLVLRGRYLVEGPGHCGECHTPRNALWAMDRNRWLAGAAGLDGEDDASNLTPHGDGLEEWDAEDMLHFMKTGVGPDFELVSGSMAHVQENLAKLPLSDREAIAAYLNAIPARPESR